MTDNPDRRPPGPPQYRPRPASALTLRRGPPPRSAAAEAEAALDTPPPFRLLFLSPGLAAPASPHADRGGGLGDDTGGTSGVKRRRLTGDFLPLPAATESSFSTDTKWRRLQLRKCLCSQPLRRAKWARGGELCGKGAGPLIKPGVIGSPSQVASPAPPPFRWKSWLHLLLGILPGLSQHLLLRSGVEKTAPLIGRFIKHRSVICYHNNPFREANRPGEGCSRGPTQPV